MNELSAKLSRSTGIAADDVAKLITALASLAYADAASGFVLPGFGKFRLVPGAEAKGTNPFTGKTTVFRAPPEVEFTIDTKAKKAFLAGKPEAALTIADGDAIETLAPIRLAPDAEDCADAGIKGERVEESNCKLGGDPDWIQAPEVPVCCGNTMHFYGQLDSLGGDYCIGDMGMLYVFLCRSCSCSRSILQCY